MFAIIILILIALMFIGCMIWDHRKQAKLDREIETAINTLVAQVLG